MTTTVNPVQTSPYNLDASANPVYFGAKTNIQVGLDGLGNPQDGIYGAASTVWSVSLHGNVTASGDGVALLSASTISNYGSISATAAGIDLPAGGNAANEKDGVVSSANGAAIELGTDGAVGNYGSLSSSAADTVAMYGAGSVSNQSSGIITAPAGSYAIAFHGGSGTIVNKGMITGDILLGAGDNSLSLWTGSILKGNVYGGSAAGTANALVLNGVGEYDGSFSNGTSLTANLTGTWLLDGVNAFTGVSIKGGDLQVGDLSHAATAGLTGKVAISAGATLSGDGSVSGPSIANAGLIEAVDPGGTLTISSQVASTGVLEAAGGVLDIAGAVTGKGSAVVASGTLQLGSTFVQNVAFTGTTGVLDLAQSGAYTGTLSGFSSTGATQLDLRDIGFVSASEATFSGKTAGGVLTVTDGTNTAHIALAGDYTTSTFIAASDGHGGVLIRGGGAVTTSTTINPVQTSQYNLDPSVTTVNFGANTKIQAGLDGSGNPQNGIYGNSSAVWTIGIRGAVTATGAGVLINSNSTVRLYGSINSVGSGIDMPASGNFLNEKGGYISSSQGHAVYFNGNGILENDAILTSASADVVTEDGSGSVSNQATGTITAPAGAYAIAFRGGPGTIVNKGIINGAILFEGPGKNALSVYTGSVLNGDVTGSTASGASTALNLNGVGEYDGNFTNGTALTANLTGTWLLTGVSSVASTAVKTGDLQIGDLKHTSAALIGKALIGAGATLSGDGSISGGQVNNAGLIEPADSAGTFTIGGPVSNTGTVQTNGAVLNINGAVSNSNGGLLQANGGTLTVTGNVSNSGTGLAEANGGTLTIAGNLTNSATTEAIGGTLTVTGKVTNTGVLQVNGGAFDIAGTVTGAGTAVIAAGTLQLGSTFNENVTFTGKTGLLDLASSKTYTGTVTGLSRSGGTQIDLRDIPSAGAKVSYAGTSAGGTLTVSSGKMVAHIKLAGDYTASAFIIAPDGHGGVLIHDPPADQVATAQAAQTVPFSPAPAPDLPIIGAAGDVDAQLALLLHGHQPPGGHLLF